MNYHEITVFCSICSESIPSRVENKRPAVCFDCKKKKQQEYYKKNKAHILEIRARYSERKRLKS